MSLNQNVFGRPGYSEFLIVYNQRKTNVFTNICPYTFCYKNTLYTEYIQMLSW